MLNRNCWTELVENSWILKSTLTFFSHFLLFFFPFFTPSLSLFLGVFWLVNSSSQAPLISVAVTDLRRHPFFTAVMEDSGQDFASLKWTLSFSCRFDVCFFSSFNSRALGCSLALMEALKLSRQKTHQVLDPRRCYRWKQINAVTS